MATTQLTDAAHIIVDPGNSGIKSILRGGNEDELKHDIAFLTEREYLRLTAMAKNRSMEYQEMAIFKKIYKDDPEVFAAVGDGAASAGRSSKQTGVQRFSKGYYDVVIAAVLLRHLPEGCENVALALGVPVSSNDYYDQLRGMLLGTHKLELLNGRQVKYRITSINFWEEPEGGMLRYFLKQDELRRNNRQTGAERAIQFNAGDRVIIADFGGRVSSLTMTRINRSGNVEILYSETPDPIPMGILNVKSEFAKQLMRNHPDDFRVFKAQTGIPEHLLDEGLITGAIVLDGTRELIAAEARMAAVSEFMQQIRSIYNEQMAGGRTAKAIALTGGGAGLLLPMLRLDVFNRDNVDLVGDSDSIQFENVRGAAQAYEEWLREHGAQKRR